MTDAELFLVSRGTTLHHARYIQQKYGAPARSVSGYFCSYTCYELFCQDVDRGGGEVFPEHTHVWEVVLIENNPVGVSCKICDDVFYTTKESPARQRSREREHETLAQSYVGTTLLYQQGVISKEMFRNVSGSAT